MPDIFLDVDVALTEVPVNVMPLIDDTDFKTRETAIVYNQAGMDLVWNFVTSAGVFTQTAVTPTTAGVYDWVNQGDGMYTIEIPASGGGSINNDTEGYGWFTGVCTGVLPWRGPILGFRAAGLNDLLTDSVYSTTRGLAGTALPAAAADAAGGLPISDAGGLDLDAKIGALTFTVANQVDANALAISGDTGAADNLESQYDGTGLTGDTYPSPQSQVGAIGAATGGGLIFEMVTDNVLGAIKGVTFVGVQTGGTYASTEAEDGVYHNITHSGNAIDIVYQVGVGGARRVTEYAFKGYLSSSNDVITVQMYDFVGAGWETRGTITGQGGTTNINQSIKALSKHTGTSGADIGISLIRFVCTAQTSPNFFVDELVASASTISQSVGYDGGQVWIDTVNGIAGTEAFVNGVADNPSLTLANAITIAASVRLNQFHVSNDSSITFAESHVSEVWDGHGWTLALGGQDISQAHIYHANDVSGTGTTPTGEVHILDSHIASSVACTLGQAHITNCLLGAGGLVLSQAADYNIDNSRSGIAGATAPTIDMGAAVGATNLAVRDWRGGLTLNNLAAGDVVSLDGIFGTITLNGADANIEIRGIAKSVVNNLTGSPTVNDSSVKATELGATLALILADTNELQTDDVPGLIAALNDPTTAEIVTAMQADGTDLHIIVEALVNKMVITEASGNTEMFNDSDVSQGTVTAAFTSDGTYTTRKRMVI